jgi:hypothetical protein
MKFSTDACVWVAILTGSASSGPVQAGLTHAHPSESGARTAHACIRCVARKVAVVGQAAQPSQSAVAAPRMSHRAAGYQRWARHLLRPRHLDKESR